MTPLNWVVTLGLVMFVAYTGWKNLPGIILMVNPTAIRSKFVDTPEGIRSTFKSNEIQELVTKLESLGFRLLGLKSEQLPLWAGFLYEISLSNYETNAFASILNRSNNLVYYFYTPFVGGAVVLTANAGFPEIQADDFIQKVAPSDNPSDILSVHQQNVQQLKDKGAAPFGVSTQAARLEATRLYYASDSFRKISRVGGVNGLFNLFGAILLSLIVAWIIWPK